MGLDRPIDITADQKKTLLALIKRHLQNTTAWVYGSRVKWTARPQSDLDLVVFTKPEQERRVSDLREAFEESNLPFRVDLFVWDAVPEQFRKQIKADYVVLVEKKKQSAVSEWARKTLGELTENFDAVRVPIKQAERRPGPYPYYGASGIVDSIDDYLFNGEYLLIAEDGENLRTRNTPIAFLAKEKFWVNNHAHIVRGNHEANTRYLMYALSELDISGYLTGSTMPKLTQGNLNQISLVIPPPSEQRAIAHILSTLDNKIELNRRMNETLEAMARALFKSWFIDFDPVRAKMAGRDPGLPQPLADLFPDRLVNSELGPTPEGWEVKTLGECFNLTMGQSPPGSTYNEQGEGLPFFQGRTDFGFRYPENRKFCTAPTRVAEPGDTLVSVRAPVGDINMAWEQCCIGRGIAALRHKTTATSYSYYFTWTIQSVLREYEQTGTVFGAINKNQFEALQVLEPDANSVDAFDSCARHLDARIRSSIAESLTLTTLRDALLPKLISGELRVKNAERLIEEAKS